MFSSIRAAEQTETPHLFTIEQCIEENIPLSAGYRDFEGYKGKYPDPKWPGNAKLCVNIVLNFEEGGEYRYGGHEACLGCNKGGAIWN